MDQIQKYQYEYVQQNSDHFDYGQCIFEVRLSKKAFLGEAQTRYVYFTKDSLVISKDPYQKIPSKILKLKPQWKVQWIYNKNNTLDEIVGFKLLTDTIYKIKYYGTNKSMLKIKDYFAKNIFQTDFDREYDIITKLGKGKYANVYQIKKKDNNQLFAAKYLDKQTQALIEKSQESLFNELKILRMLNHPNCIKFISAYESDYGYYIITELYDNQKSLQCELNKFQNKQFGYQVIKGILKQLISGLKYIHNLGIMHRDLKPQNIMFDNQENLKIIDFGLSQFTNDPYYIYVHVGTPGYVAPEILKNESDDHRYTEKVDLFSVGVILHILLTGKNVFIGQGFQQIIENNKSCNIKLNSSNLSLDAINLLNKLLEPNPLKRISCSDVCRHKFFKKPSLLTESSQQNIKQTGYLQVQNEYYQQLKLSDCTKTYQLTKELIDYLSQCRQYQQDQEKFMIKSPNKVNKKYTFKQKQTISLCNLDELIDENSEEKDQKDNINEQEGKNQNVNIFYGKEREFSKKKILLLNYFPSELFDDELEEKEVLKILGKYLLLGEENYEKEDVNIERELQIVKECQIFEQWFVLIMEKMITFEEVSIGLIKEDFNGHGLE